MTAARVAPPVPPGDEVWLAVSTAPNADVAARLGRLAVERRHAACANLRPAVRSIYRWKARLEEADEVLILFKTTAAEFPALARLVASEHPYDVPELVACPVGDGLPAYLAWVRAESGGVDRPGARA